MEYYFYMLVLVSETTKNTCRDCSFKFPGRGGGGGASPDPPYWSSRLGSSGTGLTVIDNDIKCAHLTIYVK